MALVLVVVLEVTMVMVGKQNVVSSSPLLCACARVFTRVRMFGRLHHSTPAGVQWKSIESPTQMFVNMAAMAVCASAGARGLHHCTPAGVQAELLT
eukprot:1159839-Pelagomonas_calceolata.AAC.15